MKTTLLHLLFLIHLILIAALPTTAWAERAAEANGAPRQEAASDSVSEVESIETVLVQQESALMSKWLHMLDSGEITDDVDVSVLAYAPQVLKDLARVLASTADTKDKLGVWGVLDWSEIDRGNGAERSLYFQYADSSRLLHFKL